MFNKELKKLNRRELVDVIYQMKKNEQQMQEEIDSLKGALEDKRIKMQSVGSIAEAAVNISNVFTSAQDAANLYLEEIAQMKNDAKEECEKMINEASAETEKLLADAKKQLDALSVQYALKSQMLEALQQEIEALQKDKNGEQNEDEEI